MLGVTLRWIVLILALGFKKKIKIKILILNETVLLEWRLNKKKEQIFLPIVANPYNHQHLPEFSCQWCPHLQRYAFVMSRKVAATSSVNS